MIILKFVLENIFENTKNTVLMFSKNYYFSLNLVFFLCFSYFSEQKKERKKSNMFFMFSLFFLFKKKDF